MKTNRKGFLTTLVLGPLAIALGLKVKPNPVEEYLGEVVTYKPELDLTYATYTPVWVPAKHIPIYTNELLMQGDKEWQEIVNLRMTEAGEYARKELARMWVENAFSKSN